jgi:glycosyltransferase involved in cell wall biosynthesis
MIAVVMPVYNGRNHILSSIEAVLEQHNIDVELIVVDDGSTDETASFVRDFFSDRIIILSQENSGASVARNLALSYVKKRVGRYTHVAFCDADDLWHSHKLVSQVQAMETNNSLLSYTNGNIINEDGVNVRDSLPYYRKNITLNQLLIQNPIATSSVVISLTKLKNLTSLVFDPQLHGTEDWDLWITLGSHNSWLSLDEKLISYRVVNGSLSSFSLDYHYQNIKVLQKHDELISCIGSIFKLTCYMSVMTKFVLQALRYNSRIKPMRHLLLLPLIPILLLYFAFINTYWKIR